MLIHTLPRTPTKYLAQHSASWKCWININCYCYHYPFVDLQRKFANDQEFWPPVHTAQRLFKAQSSREIHVGWRADVPHLEPWDLRAGSCCLQPLTKHTEVPRCLRPLCITVSRDKVKHSDKALKKRQLLSQELQYWAFWSLWERGSSAVSIL